MCWKLCSRITRCSSSHMYVQPAVRPSRETYDNRQLHQILPSVLSILLSSTLGPPSLPTFGSPSIATRQHASNFLASLLSRYSRAYSSLKPRILQTLLRGLINGCSADTRYAGTLVGALLGLKALGRDSIRRVFGARSPNLARLGEALQRDSMLEQDREVCLNTVLSALQDAYPESEEQNTFDYLDLESYTGQYFASHINARCSASVANGILNEPTEETVNWTAAQPALTNGFNGHQESSSSRRDSLAASTGAGESQDAEGSGEDDESEDVDMDAVNA